MADDEKKWTPEFAQKGIQELGEEARKAAEVLRKQNLNEEMSTLKSELSAFKSDSSKVRSAIVEMTRSIDRLRSPLLSHAASIIESISSYRQATELQKRQTAVAQQNLKEAQSNLDAGKAEQTLLLERIKNAKEAKAALIKSKEEYTKESMALGALNDVKATEIELKKQEIERLKQVPVPSVGNPYLDKAQSELATLQDEYNKQFGELVQRIEQQTKEEDGHNSAVAELTKRIEEDIESAKKQKEANEELVKAQIKAKEELDKQKAEETATKLRKLADVASTVSVALQDFVKTIRDTQNKLGISSSNALDVVIGNAVGSFKSFFSATTVSAEEIMAQREAFQEEFGGVISGAAATDLAQQAKELGVTGQQLAKARRAFMTSTMGDLGQAKAQQDQFLETFRQQGLTNKDAMNAIAQYSELYARNGSRFADSFARAAIEAKKIGVDLGKIDQVGDNIIGDFEGFLEKTAELGAMGFNLDTTRLGEAAESGDTGALMNELRSQLAATGKDLTNLRRSEQLALSNAFGIPMAELQRLAAPTAGSGEQLTEQEQTNSILTIIADKAAMLTTIFSAVLGLLSGTHTLLLSRIAMNTGGGGISDMFTGVKSKFSNLFGGSAAGAAGQSAAGALASAAPTGGADAASGISKLSSSINPTSLIKGAAAILIMAGALFVMGKALQQFKEVGLRELGIALGSMVALTAAMFALGALMSGPQAALLLVGVASLVVMAGAVWLLGKALQSVGDSAEGISMLGTSFDSLSTAMEKFNEVSLNEDNVKKIKDLATPTLGQSIRKMADTLVNNAIEGNIAASTNATTATAAPVDFSRLEAKLDQVVKAIGSMEVKLDATKVGEIVVTNERRVANTGIFAQSRTT